MPIREYKIHGQDNSQTGQFADVLRTCQFTDCGHRRKMFHGLTSGPIRWQTVWSHCWYNCLFAWAEIVKSADKLN